jgi:hypothetical protein
VDMDMDIDMDQGLGRGSWIIEGEFRGRAGASKIELVTRRRSSFPLSAPRIARDRSASATLQDRIELGL